MPLYLVGACWLNDSGIFLVSNVKRSTRWCWQKLQESWKWYKGFSEIEQLSNEGGAIMKQYTGDKFKDVWTS